MADLSENVLTADQEAYVDWLCIPTPDRGALGVPSSKEKYAEHAGVDVTTLRRWEKKDTFRRMWQERVKEVIGSPDREKTIMDKLFEQAKAGDVKSAELYFKVTGRMAPQQLTVKTGQAASELSDAELQQLIVDRAATELAGRAEVRLLKPVG